MCPYLLSGIVKVKLDKLYQQQKLLKNKQKV